MFEKHLILGYRHHKEDALFEGHKILSIPWYRPWRKALREAIKKLNANPDLKHYIIITFVTKL
jgi:hypothetical protein